MSTKSKIAAAVALGALVLTANHANAQYRADGHSNVRHLPRAHERTYGYVPREVRQHRPARNDIYYSDSLGRQPFANPDRDFSIENLQSHAN